MRYSFDLDDEERSDETWNQNFSRQRKRFLYSIEAFFE